MRHRLLLAWIVLAFAAACAGAEDGLHTTASVGAGDEVAGETPGGDDPDRVPAEEDAADAGGGDAGGEGGDDAGDVDAGVEEPPRCAAAWSERYGASREWLIGEALENQSNICENDMFFVVAPQGMRLSLEAARLPVGTRLEARAMTGEALGEAVVSGDGATYLTWTQLRSGEVQVRVERPRGEEAPLWRGLLSCASGCEEEATRYPIVLVHGMAGTDSYFGVLDYFYDVVNTLGDAGFVAYTPVSRFIGHSEVRAAQIAEQLEVIFKETGASKVHLIAHSQGGLDIRVLVSGLGYAERVASMTTISSPHQGLSVELPEWLTGMDFSAVYLQGEFAQTYPDVESIPRFSWAGISCSRLDFGCQRAHDGEVVDLLLGAAYHTVRLLHRSDAWEGANDGVVPVAASIWGEFLGLLPADHFDEVGQIADGRGGAFNHRAFYLSEARRLRALELERGL